MADTTVVTQDPNAPNPLGIELPTFDTGEVPDTSYHITVRPHVDDKAQKELQDEVAAEDARKVAEAPMPSTQYSSQIQEALASGYSRSDVSSYLAKKSGISQDDADAQVVDALSSKVKEARAQGYSDDQIEEHLYKRNYDPEVVKSAITNALARDGYQKLDPAAQQEPLTTDEAGNMADLYKNIHSKYSTMGKQVLGVFSASEGIDAARDVYKLNQGLVVKLKEHGVDAFIKPGNGELMMREANGYEHEVDSSFLRGMFNSKGEFTGAISGAMAGARAGAAIGTAVGPEGTAAGAVLGGMAGSAMGAMAGRGVDLMLNSAKLKEDLEAKLYLTQMAQAGIFDITAGTLGMGVAKLGKSGARAIMKAYRYTKVGNKKGAFKALMDELNITREQAQDMVDQYEQLNSKTAPGDSLEQKAIAVATVTQQSADGVLKAAASKNSKLANAVRSDVNARAKSLSRAINSYADDNTGALVRRDLSAYGKDVKDFYGAVKKQGADAVDGTDFRFDYNKLAVAPVLKNIEKKISNPLVQERYVAYATRIENASKDRSFSGLLELRHAVNEFKYSKLGLSAPDQEALNGVLNKIDGSIAKAAKEYMPKGKQWLDNFKLAKSEYSQMKRLESNALFKYVHRSAVTEEGIQKALSKYANSKDVDEAVFNDVVERLSPATRAKVEMAAVKNLTAKFTAGEFTDMQATHFPALAEALRGLNLATPEAKNIAKTVNEIARVYRNDAVLTNVNGNMSLPKVVSSLSSNPVQKAHYAIMGEIFNEGMRFLPGKKANNLALIHQAEKLLQNPMHGATADNLVKMVPKSSQDAMRSLVKDLQVQTAKVGGAKPKATVNMYRQTVSGTLSPTNGAWGRGVYLVDKVVGAAPEAKVVRHAVDMSRMATLDDVSSLVGKQVTEKDLKTIPNLTKQLQDKGFIGIRGEGKAMIFPDNIKP